MPVTLEAVKRLKYGARWYAKGERFDALSRHAQLLIATKQAKHLNGDSPLESPGPVPVDPVVTLKLDTREVARAVADAIPSEIHIEEDPQEPEIDAPKRRSYKRRKSVEDTQA